MEFVAKRCGVKFDPPSIVLVYEDGKTKKMRKRIMPVRNFSKFSGRVAAAAGEAAQRAAGPFARPEPGAEPGLTPPGLRPRP
ncbi:hypothetical protein GJAV_G00083540 [Gymnothorax javanicus]|nr:hypothetical protein GJAV_G00083540 [Gymnothorax javanicus]